MSRVVGKMSRVAGKGRVLRVKCRRSRVNCRGFRKLSRIRKIELLLFPRFPKTITIASKLVVMHFKILVSYYLQEEGSKTHPFS